MNQASQKPASVVDGSPSQIVQEMDYSKYLEADPTDTKPKKKTPAQKKAAKLERLRLKKIEDKKIVITDHFMRELELSRKSAQKGHREWVEMCKDIKCAELKEELAMLKAKTDRINKAKEDKIIALIADIEDTKLIHKNMFGKHVQCLDYLIVIYQALMVAAKEVYEAQASEALKEFHMNLRDRDLNVEAAQNHCDNIMHATNLITRQELFNGFKIFQLKVNDIVADEVCKRYQARDLVVLKMNEIRDQLRCFVKKITDTSLDLGKYQRIESLMNHQRTFAQEMYRVNNAVSNLLSTQQVLQRKLLRIETQAMHKMQALQADHAFFLRIQQDIERQIKKDEQETFEKLKVMSIESEATLKIFKGFERKGEILLSLAAACRKLQTEAERVSMWEGGLHVDVDDEEIIKIRTLDLAAHVDMSEEEMEKIVKLMTNFWHRQGVVEAQNMMLKGEIQRLKEENQKYIDIVKSLGAPHKAVGLEQAITVTSVKPEEHLQCMPQRRRRPIKTPSK